MATIKLRDYLLALSSKGTAAVDSDKLTILDSADSNAIKTILKSDLVDLDYLVSELQDDFLDQFGEGTFSGSTQVDHDATTNFVANEHIDHTSVSIIAGAGLTGGGDISSDRTINIVSDNNGIVVNADQIELDTDSSTFSGGVLTKMNIEQVVSGSSQISADQTDGWVGDVKTQLNSNTVISGSSQVILNDADKTGFDTADVVEGTNLYYTDARVLSKINTEGVLSGSTFSSPSQGTLRATINGVDSDVDLGLQSGDNVTFTDGNFTGNVVITGNLDVLGDAVEIQTSDLRIEDKLITVASGSATSVAADGAGLEVDGADKSMKWNHSTQQFVFDAKVSSSVGFKGEGGELTGIDTDQVTEAGNLYYTDSRVKTKLNIEGVLSGSAQIATEISGAAFTSASNEFGELTLTKNGSSVQLDLSPRKVLELVKNKDPQTLPKGTPVYVSGSTGNAAHVYAASASRADRMPAAYVLDQELAFDEEGNGIVVGFINGVNTSGFNEGDEVYVGINGGYTNVKPTGNSNRIQKLGNVIKSAVNGSGVITGVGRSNDVPNIQEGYVWVGGNNDVSYQLSTSSLLSGQGVISGSSQIDVTQTTNYGSINQYTDSDNTSHLNSLGVVSGSSQIDHDQTTNFSADEHFTQANITTVGTVTTGNVDAILPTGTVSGSSQIDVTQTTNYGSINQYTDSDNLSYLNSLLVVSKSANGDLDVNGSITGSKLSISKDVDSQNFIGRAMIGNQNVGFGLSPDVATFSHIDQTDYQSYGFSQTSTGVTIINHPTTQYISFRNDNTEIARFDNTDYFGINTDNPLTRLHVSGSTTIEDGDLDVSGDITGSGLSIIDTSNPGSDYGSVVIEGRRDGSPNVLTLRAKDNGTPASALPQDQGAVVRWQGFDGTDFANMGYILVAADGQAVAASDAPSYMAFGVSPDASETPSEVMRLDSDGVLSLNDTSNDVFINNNGTAMELDVNRHPETGVFSDTAKGHARISLIGDTGGSKISFNTANTINTTATTVATISSSSLDVNGGIITNDYVNIKADDAELYFTNGANTHYYRFKRTGASGDLVLDHYDGTNTHDRITVDNVGRVNFQTGSYDITTKGVTIDTNGRVLVTTANNVEPLLLNRQDNDGLLVEFRQANGVVGDISVSSGTVSYNPFMGSHYSEGVTDLPKGTVLETIDELVTEKYSSQQRLPKVKVSDISESSAVYGVWLGDDEQKLVAAVGASWCRINSSVTVEIGDLLTSNGDGTAKVQSDDIIRSKTIGKVTSTIKVETYDDGSYLVPVVLYCG